MNIFQRWKQTAIHNKALVWTGVLVAFGTIFYAGAATYQALLMKHSARDSAAQIASLMSALNSSINMTIEQSRKSLSDAIQENKRALDAALAQNKSALDATAKQGRDALNASIEASRLDQRAWVGVGEMRVVNKMIKGEILHVTIAMRNTGKTPALSLHIHGHSRFHSRLALPSDTAIDAGQETALAPGLDYTARVRFPLPLLEQDVIFLESGRYELIIYGTVTYRDIFPGTPIRETGFCGAYSAEDKPLLSSCPADMASLSYMK